MSTSRDQIDRESRSNVHNLRGLDLAERGWIDEAINEFQNAIKNAPDFVEGYDNLGMCYADKGRLMDALTAYTKALALEPENPVVLHNLGCFLSNFGSQLAATCFKSAFTIEPDFHEAHFNLGLCLAAEEKHHEAIAEFDAALTDDHFDYEVRFQRALSLIAIGNNSLAIKELMAIVKHDKKHDQAWFFLGASLEDQGFLQEAKNAFSTAIKENPTHLDAILSLASLLMRLDLPREARALVKRADALDHQRTKEFVAEDEYLCDDTQLNSRRNK